MVAMTPRSLRNKIGKLKIMAPVTEDYAHSLESRGIWSSEGVWYNSQKQHWTGWLGEYDGPGAYSRKTH
jgi:hypothetical protein